MTKNNQTSSGLIRQNLSLIEEKISNGFSYVFILDEINKNNGTDINLDYFRTLLYRARQDFKKKNPPSSIKGKPEQSATKPEPVKPVPESNNENKSSEQSLDEVIGSDVDLSKYSKLIKNKGKL